GSERRDRATPERDVLHRHPRGELADCLGHEARWERRDCGRDGVAADRTLARFELVDPIDERERGEMIGHGGTVERAGFTASEGSRRSPQAAACWRCASTTSLQNVSTVNSRGMSFTLVGFLKRSAGTSER